MPQRRRHREGDQQERPDISVEAKTKVWIEQYGHFLMGDGGLHVLRAIRHRGSLTLPPVMSDGRVATLGSTLGAASVFSVWPSQAQCPARVRTGAPR